MSKLSDPRTVLKDASDIDRYLWLGGTTMSVVLDAHDTQGQFALIDQQGVSGDSTPLHRHLNEDEAFYVLDGEIVAVAGDRECRARAGSALFLPRGLPHAFMITSGQHAYSPSRSRPASKPSFERPGFPFRDRLPRCGSSTSTGRRTRHRRQASKSSDHPRLARRGPSRVSTIPPPLLIGRWRATWSPSAPPRSGL